MLFFHTYPVAIPFLTLLLAEIIKAFIDVIHKRKKIRFINPGGMPSGHSAFVSALVVTVAYRDTIESTAFMISAALALIVMYDAVNLRNQAGLHAKIINKLKYGSKLEESLGHTIWEVIVGAVFGAVLAFLLLNV
jgi:acid phosphatase family membrane protein YuiD